MTRENKILFVTSHCNSIKQEICSKIESGKIPENWDGYELRSLIAEKFNAEIRMTDKREKRYREYENTVLAENL